MRKLLAAIVCIVFLLPCFSCSEGVDLSSMSPEELQALISEAQKQLSLTEPEMMEKAISLLKDTWLNDEKRGYKSALNQSQHGYLEILHTQVSYISDSVSADESLYNGLFYNIYCVIDFVLLSDYFGSEPYYMDAGINTSVVVFLDGSMEVRTRSVFSDYSARTYSYDYSGIISSVINYGADYNATFYLLDEEENKVDRSETSQVADNKPIIIYYAKVTNTRGLKSYKDTTLSLKNNSDKTIKNAYIIVQGYNRVGDFCGALEIKLTGPYAPLSDIYDITSDCWKDTTTDSVVIASIRLIYEDTSELKISDEEEINSLYSNN